MGGVSGIICHHSTAPSQRGRAGAHVGRKDEGASWPWRSGRRGGLRAVLTGGRCLADPGLNGVTASSWGVQCLSGSPFSVAGHRWVGPGLSGGGAVEGTRSQGLWDRTPSCSHPHCPVLRGRAVLGLPLVCRLFAPCVQLARAQGWGRSWDLAAPTVWVTPGTRATPVPDPWGHQPFPPLAVLFAITLHV